MKGLGAKATSPKAPKTPNMTGGAAGGLGRIQKSDGAPATGSKKVKS